MQDDLGHAGIPLRGGSIDARGFRSSMVVHAAPDPALRGPSMSEMMAPQRETERLTNEVVRLRVENERLTRRVNEAEDRRLEPLVVVQAGGREARAYLLQSGTLLIKIGCHVAEWDWWVENGDRVADQHGGPREKEDLRSFLLFVKTFAAPYLRARERATVWRPEPFPTDPEERAAIARQTELMRMREQEERERAMARAMQNTPRPESKQPMDDGRKEEANG